MLKVKTFFFLFLPLLFVFLLPLTTSAAIIDEPIRQEYAQNNIIFYRYCNPDNESGCSYIDTGSTTPSTPTTPETPETPSSPETPSTPETPETPVTGSCGCPDGCGKQNASGMESQNDGHNTYKSILWKKYDEKDVQASGCSLVSVVNAANATGVSATITDAASWSYSNLDVKTGSWDGTVKPIANHFGLELIALFDNVHSGGKKASSVSEKLTLIKQALASGKAVIASGKVTEVGTGGYSHCGNRAKARGIDGTTFANQGNCVFTPGGHYVAIVGVTKDNKLVITNPALGSKSATGWIFPAENALQFADIAMAAGKKGSGGLITCSE